MKLNIYGNQPIITPRDPLVPMEAANKNYVDNGLRDHVNNLELHLTPGQNTFLDNLTVTYQELNALSGTGGNVQTQIDTKVSKAGDIMTGFLTLSDAPVNNLHAATKLYVDSQEALKVSKAGDSMTGALTLSGDPTSALQAAPKQYVDSTVATHAADASLHVTANQNTFLDNLNTSFTEVNSLVGINGNVQTQLNTKVDKAGDTMTGALVLAGNPVANLDAAPKQYVDSQDAFKVAKAGDTMTGALVLPGDPTVALQAAPKQYVDSSVATHATDDSLHLTALQNTLLDAITVSATNINQLANISGNVQTQIDAKVAKAGDTMTGALVLSGDPVANLEATPKQYVDAQDALNVAKAGDTMTGALVLPGDPVTSLEAAPKQYVDTKVATHADDVSLHVTASQNTLLDSLTVSAGDINQLSGVTGNVQSLLDLKFDKVGGTVSGDITMSAGKTIFVSKVPTSGTELVNKTYVDSLVVGQKWEDPVSDINLVSVSTSTPPASPVNDDVYIVGANATGAWASKEGYATYFNGTSWVFLQNRAVDVGDRFGVAFTSSTVLADSLAGKEGVLLTIISNTPGAVTFTEDTIAAGSTTLVFDPQSSKFGVTYTRTDEGTWVATNTSVNLTAGDGLSLTGNILNFNYGTGLTIDNDVIKVNFDVNKGIALDVNGAIYVPQDGSTITITSAGVKVSDAVMADIANRISKTDASNVTGAVTFTASSSLKTEFTATTNTDVVNKGYVDAADVVLQTQITNTDAIVSTLNTDPVTKAYTDSQDALKVNKAGDTMTGALVLPGDPTIALQAAPKQYVDSVLAAHSSNEELHLTAGQNTFLDNLTVTYQELNALSGTGTNVQTQIDSKVAKAGDTMTGPLVLLGNPVNNLEAAPKQYVDTQDALKVAKAGDAMTGYLTLNADPISNLHAATKAYVDSTELAHFSNESLHLTSIQNALLDAVISTATEINTLQNVTGNVQTQIDAKVAKAGDTMTGALVLPGDPVSNLEAATKQYVDSQNTFKVAKAGDTMTGALVLPGNPTSALQAAPKQYVDTNIATHANDTSLHISTEQNTFLDGLTVTYDDVNQLFSIDGNVQDQIDSKVNLSGGTLTGFLTLHADPVGNLQATTKQYADSQDALKVAKAGDTMTGALVLPGDPVSNLEAAPKQYVDSNVSTLTTYVNNQDALKIAKAGDTMTGLLTLSGAPTVDMHAATKLYVDTTDLNRKSYVDAADLNLQTQINTIGSTVTTLNLDSVTKMYVDSQDALKVSKAGDTLTGYLTLHADPQQAMHPTTKQYVDAIAQGLSTKPAVRLATTVNLAAVYNNGNLGISATLTGSANGALFVDGKAALTNDRILVMSQTDKVQNGDYVVQQTGNASSPFILKRVNTVDESTEVPSSFFYVSDGDTLKGTGWTFNVADPVSFTIGTDAIIVNQFSGSGALIAGEGLTINGNTIDINTANPTRILVNADNIDLAPTDVNPGTYTRVTVDGYGRATAGFNPNTLAGYGITDGQLLNANLTSLSSVTATGIVVRDATNTILTKAITVGGIGLSINNGSGANAGDIAIASNATDAATPETIVSRDASGNFGANVITAALNGNANTATALQNTRSFSVNGDVTATEVSFNGTANVALNTTLTDTGIVAGTYTKTTFDAKGRATSGTTPTAITDLGVTDVYTKAEVDAITADLRREMAELYLYVINRI